MNGKEMYHNKYYEWRSIVLGLLSKYCIGLISATIVVWNFILGDGVARPVRALDL